MTGILLLLGVLVFQLHVNSVLLAQTSYIAPIQNHPSGVTLVSWGDAGAEPKGMILSPKPGSNTGREVSVSVITRDLPLGRPHVYLVVDVPSIGYCWPKTSGIAPNTAFRTTIHEAGTRSNYRLSLYAVDNNLHQTIRAWFNRGAPDGLPMLPERFRLDYIELKLSEV